MGLKEYCLHILKNKWSLVGCLLIVFNVLHAQQKDIYHNGWIDFNKNGRKDIYEDASQSLAHRLDDLIAQMTVAEKTMQLVTLYGFGRVAKDELPTPTWKNELWKDGLANIDEASNGVAKNAKYTFPYSKHVWALNTIQRFFIEETRLGIPVEFTNEGIRGLNHVKATAFPAQIGMGSTWNPALALEVGRVIGKEAQALGYHNIYSPVLDVARDQRWGRIVESFGEDPYLVSEFGVQISKGIQENGVANTLKHYAVYAAPKGGRDGHVRLDPHVSLRDMHQMYMFPFKRVIAETNVLGVMSSYNDYDGEPITGSYYFLTELLRDTYGFNGYVVSDSGALSDIYAKHKVAASYKEAVLKAIRAGLNVRTTFNHPENFITPLRALVAEGKISTTLLDQRVREVLAVKFKEGLFDQPYRLEEKADKIVKQENHKALSLQASRESIILLQNKKSILPLDKTKLNRVLVCGPTAQSTTSSISRYGALGVDVVSGHQGIVSYLEGSGVQVDFEPGIPIKDDNWPDSEVFEVPLNDMEQQMIQSAVSKAQQSDVVILFVGEDETMVGENLSRTSLDLPGHQKALVRALAKTGKPLVVVLINGRPLSINLSSRQADAILEAWFPGEFGGQAIAEVLFGDYNPGGKLPVTMLRSVGQIPFSFPYKPSSHRGQAQEGPNGTGDSRVVTELFPFGHGLSYTVFEYSHLKLEGAITTDAGSLKVRFTVKNTGSRAGDVVPQLYINDAISSRTVYEWQLRGFKRLHLKAGESKELYFTLHPKDLTILDADMKPIVEPGLFNLAIGESSQNFKLKASFTIKN